MKSLLSVDVTKEKSRNYRTSTKNLCNHPIKKVMINASVDIYRFRSIRWMQGVLKAAVASQKKFSLRNKLEFPYLKYRLRKKREIYVQIVSCSMLCIIITASSKTENLYREVPNLLWRVTMKKFRTDK